MLAKFCYFVAKLYLFYMISKTQIESGERYRLLRASSFSSVFTHEKDKNMPVIEQVDYSQQSNDDLFTKKRSQKIVAKFEHNQIIRSR